MHTTRTIFLAVCCFALLTACQRPQLPATTFPTEHETAILIPSSSAESMESLTDEITSAPAAESTAEPVATAPPDTELVTEPPTTAPPVTEPVTEPPVTEPSPETEAPPYRPVLDRERAEKAFHWQNQLLASHQVPSLQWSEALYQIAARRAEEISYDYSHNGCPDWVAENILMGTNDPELAVQIWYDSPGHQHNILAGWTYGAIANYGTYWVAIYAMAETP